MGQHIKRSIGLHKNMHTLTCAHTPLRPRWNINLSSLAADPIGKKKKVIQCPCECRLKLSIGSRVDKGCTLYSRCGNMGAWVIVSQLGYIHLSSVFDTPGIRLSFKSLFFDKERASEALDLRRGLFTKKVSLQDFKGWFIAYTAMVT